MNDESVIATMLERIGQTIFHPQWLSLRQHQISRAMLRRINNALVVDVGSGNADMSGMVGDNCRVVRVDHLTTSARYRKHPDVFADAVRLPIADASVDVVLLLEVLEHITDDHRAIDEVHRIVRGGGTLAISVPFVYPEHDVPYDFRRFTVAGLRRQLEAAGFEIELERRHGNSIVVALQMLNLSLLELTRDILRRSRLGGWCIALASYPICLMINVVAWPCCYLSIAGASYFGCFVLARKRV